MLMMNHWADDRKSVPCELPTGTCVLIEPSEESVVLFFKPVTDQPSAREELALALEAAAAALRGG